MLIPIIHPLVERIAQLLHRALKGGGNPHKRTFSTSSRDRVREDEQHPLASHPLQTPYNNLKQRWQNAIDGLDAKFLSVEDINSAFLQNLETFLQSEFGQRIGEHLTKEMTEGSLFVPIYLTEEFVFHRMKCIIRREAINWAIFFGWRAAAFSIMLNGVKKLAKRLTRKRKKLHAACSFLSDVVFPTEFFGPVLGIVYGVMQLTGRVSQPLAVFKLDHRKLPLAKKAVLQEKPTISDHREVISLTPVHRQSRALP